MAIDQSKSNAVPYSIAHIENMGFDPEFQLPVVEVVGHDGQNVQRLNANNLTLKYIVNGSDIYVGEAAPGTALSDNKWKAYKFTGADGTITYADGNSNFDNIATDLTALSYS